MKKKGNKWKTNMVETNPTISIIISNTNVLNIPLKDRLSEWIKKQCCL